MKYLSSDVLKNIYRPRLPESHKGDFGNLLIIGGNNIYTGSPALVAMAALRAGTDLTCIAAPRRAADIAAGFSQNIITCPLAGEILTESHINTIQKMLPRYDAVVIGNGIGLDTKTKVAVLKFLKMLKKPCVVDADAIKMLAGEKLGPNFVLTPHAVEFSVLTGEVGASEMSVKMKVVKQTAKYMGCSIALKGHVDIISDGQKTALNRTGNPYMTKGGTGDVFAGVCGSFLARDVKPFDAACAAAYLTGKAGDLAAKEFGEGLLATDLIEYIPRAIK